MCGCARFECAPWCGAATARRNTHGCSRRASAVFRGVAQQFCTLVESLLEQHLNEIGVTGEEFVAVCQRARDGRDINKMVFEQIMAVDDFLSESCVAKRWTRGLHRPSHACVPLTTAFKKLMQQRNWELELEAVKCVPTPAPAVGDAATHMRLCVVLPRCPQGLATGWWPRPERRGRGRGGQNGVRAGGEGRH